MTNTTVEYVPGTCNICPQELRTRKKSVLFALILTVALVLLLALTDANRMWRLTLFIPVAYLVISFQQTYFKFCVRFGMKGVFNFGDLGKTDSIQQAEFRKQDRAKAIQMLTTGILAGLAAAIIFYLLPF
jgi:hypothetical protein